MKFLNKVRCVSLVFLLAITSFASADKVVPIGEAYKKVALENYIKTQLPDKKGGKSILPIQRVTFDAALMSKPKEGKFNYIYMALDMMGMRPMPVITHQVFVQAKDGKVISVYLEEHFAKSLEKHIMLGNIKIGNDLTFKGYHSYNYKRGPAMVMEGLFDEKKDKLTKLTNASSKNYKEREALAKAENAKTNKKAITDVK